MFKFIFNVILLSASLGLFFMFLKPVYSDNPNSIKAIQSERASIEKTRQSLQALQDKQQKLSAERNAFSSRSDGAEQKLERMLPTQVNPILLIIEFNTIASEYGVTLKGLSVDSAKGDPKQTPTTSAQPSVSGRKPFNISFSVDTSYENFIKFIHAIESNLRITDVTEVTVNPNDKVNLYQYSVKAVTYSSQ